VSAGASTATLGVALATAALTVRAAACASAGGVATIAAVSAGE